MRFVRAVRDSHCTRGDIEDQLFASEVVRGSEDHLSVIEPVQRASTHGITPLKVVLVGLILKGLMPILRAVS